MKHGSAAMFDIDVDVGVEKFIHHWVEEVNIYNYYCCSY